MKKYHSYRKNSFVSILYRFAECFDLEIIEVRNPGKVNSIAFKCKNGCLIGVNGGFGLHISNEFQKERLFIDTFNWLAGKEIFMIVENHLEKIIFPKTYAELDIFLSLRGF